MYPLWGLLGILTVACFKINFVLKRDIKKKLYIFTDSRGYRIDKWYLKKSPIKSYIYALAQENYVKYSVSKYKHTTLIDFLYDISRAEVERYDAIILHAGIVDFSPRPLSQVKSILKRKKKRICKLFGENAFSSFEDTEILNAEYMGEKTACLYPVSVLEQYIIPTLNRLKVKIIWVGINKVVNNWNGNYHSARPANINDMLTYQKLANELFDGCVIDLSSWDDDKIRSFTFDNIHLTASGFRELEQEIMVKILSG